MLWIRMNRSQVWKNYSYFASASGVSSFHGTWCFGLRPFLLLKIPEARWPGWSYRDRIRPCTFGRELCADLSARLGASDFCTRLTACWRVAPEPQRWAAFWWKTFGPRVQYPCQPDTCRSSHQISLLSVVHPPFSDLLPKNPTIFCNIFPITCLLCP